MSMTFREATHLLATAAETATEGIGIIKGLIDNHLASISTACAAVVAAGYNPDELGQAISSLERIKDVELTDAASALEGVYTLLHQIADS